MKTFTARSTALAALSTILVLASPAAMAAGSASVTFTNMNLSAVDLDPLDGIAPQMTLSDAGFLTALKADVTEGSAVSYPDFYKYHPEFVIPVHETIGTPSLGGLIDLTPGADPWRFNAQVRADLSLAQVKQPQTNSVHLTFLTGPAGDIFSGDPLTSLVLSPHTQLRLTGQIDLHADLAGPVSEGGVTGNAKYQAGWELSLFSMDTGGGDSKYEYLDPTKTDASTALLMVIDNPTDQPINVALSLTGMAAATGTVTSAVPEPASYALMLTGLLALMGWRRRQGISQSQP